MFRGCLHLCLTTAIRPCYICDIERCLYARPRNKRIAEIHQSTSAAAASGSEQVRGASETRGLVVASWLDSSGDRGNPPQESRSDSEGAAARRKRGILIYGGNDGRFAEAGEDNKSVACGSTQITNE